MALNDGGLMSVRFSPAAAAPYPANGAIWCRACAQLSRAMLHRHARHMRDSPNCMTAHLRCTPDGTSNLEVHHASDVRAGVFLPREDW